MPRPAGHSIGRPSKFTPALFEEITARLSKGEPLAAICRDDHMPAQRTVYDWMKGEEALSASFARARAEGFDAIASECLDIANTPLNGVETVTKADGSVETREGDMLGHRKLQIETRLKLLAKWDPKRYGDKVDVNHGGEVGMRIVRKVYELPPE